MKYYCNIEKLRNFSSQNEQLGIVKRKSLNDSDLFFQKLMNTTLNLKGYVFKDTSKKDIEYILKDKILLDLQKNPFYEIWISDMSNICKTFCDTLRQKSISFCLATRRGCRRFHIDNVPMRLLVTYYGEGTEWLPNEAANRTAFENGETNEFIIKHKSAIQNINAWDIAIFRGGLKGLLHRTPDSALKHPSILIRLDHKSF